MADTARRVLCRTCGAEVSIYDAKPYFTGRRTQYECRECAKRGNMIAQNHAVTTIYKFRKEIEQ